MPENSKRLRLAERCRDGWELLNVQELQEDSERHGCPFSLPLPDCEETNNLRTGQKVKLIFEMLNGSERAWVQVQGRRGGLYFGKASDPVPGCLRMVGKVVFTGDYVLEVE